MHLNDLDYIYKLKSNSFSRTEAGLQSHHDKSLEIEGKGFAYGWTSVWELGLGQSIHEWSLQTKAIWQTHFGNMSGMQIRSLSAHEVVFIWGMKQRINRKKNIGIRILMIYSTSYPFFLEIH